MRPERVNKWPNSMTYMMLMMMMMMMMMMMIMMTINNKTIKTRVRYTKIHYGFVYHKSDKDRPVIEPDIWGQRPASYCRQVTP